MKKARYPKGSLVIRDYEKFDQYVSAFAESDLPLLILVSSAGTGKSFSVRQAMGDDALWIEGSASAFGIYQALYQNIDRPVVIDDVDELFRDRAAIRLLKCLCQTDPVKRLGWYTNSTTSRANVPREFKTSSRTMIIANEWETINRNVAAVQDRGMLVFFEPTLEALHAKVAEWFWDQEIYDFVGKNLFLFPDLSMRNYVNASALKDARLDWMDVFYAETECERTLLIAKLLEDESCSEDRQRIETFKSITGESRRTYYNYKKRLVALMKRGANKCAHREVQGKRPEPRPQLKLATNQI